MKKLVSITRVKNPNDVLNLRKLLDQVESRVRNLKSLKVETNSYGQLPQPTFQRRINVVSTLWINVEIMLI